MEGCTSIEAETLLKSHDIRPTAVRIMLWRTLTTLDYAFSLADVEVLLPTVDRSTLFRALTLFAEQQLLRVLDDGMGQHKYCVTPPSHEEEHHVHLTCTYCGKTFCLKSQNIPEVEVPEGFVVEEVQYVIRGRCAACAHKRKN